MTDRSHWLQQISLYTDGQLSPEEVAALEAALRADPALRQDFLEYLNLDSALEDCAAESDVAQEPATADSIPTRSASEGTAEPRIANAEAETPARGAGEGPAESTGAPPSLAIQASGRLRVAFRSAKADDRFRRTACFIAAAAAVVFAITLAVWWQRREKPGPFAQPEVTLAAGWRIQPIGDAEYQVVRPDLVRLQRGDLCVMSGELPDDAQSRAQLTIETPAGAATSRGDWFVVGIDAPAPTQDTKEPTMSRLSGATRVLVLAGLVTLVNSHGSVSGTADHLLAAEPGKAPMDKGLPKTAIKELEPVIAKALADKNYPLAIKAIGRKIALEGIIQGNKPEEKIVRLQAEIAKAPKEMHAVMETILAEWYWQYFQRNRGRFIERTQTAAPPGKDFTTWDLPRILAEIDRHFTQALSSEAELKKIKVSQYGDLLTKGTLPDRYRPTLFDFIAHQALAFYSAGEQAGAKAEDEFDLTAASPIFDAPGEFLKWDVKTTDGESRTVKAIRLYQDLLRFHQQDEDKTAFLDADLARLQFGFNQAFGQQKNARYKAALKRFVDQWRDHEVSAVARAWWAGVLYQEGNPVEAHVLAKQGWEAFQQTVGGRMCFNLMRQIEAKSAQMSTERVWNEPWPTIRITYRNLTQVHFRIVRDDWAARIKNARNRPEALDDKQREALLAKKPDLEWSERLPATEDFRERTVELKAPKDLQPGFHFLIASGDPAFSDKNNLVTFTDFWVSTLALVTRTRSGDPAVEGYVLEANSGEPLEGAEVRIWTYSETGNTGRWIAGPATKSDKSGRFSLRGQVERNHILLARFNDQQLSSGDDRWIWNSSRAQRHADTVFFTDRSLYRPGQTIHYKGLCIDVDLVADDYKAIGGQTLTVVFRDTNDKEIARQQHRTNDYGSFSGSFTAPRDRLMGSMRLEVSDGPSGQAYFNVEEYKRPKFQVTVDAPKAAAKLGAKVNVQGKAMAYTGAAVDGAKVRWRVVREVRYPDWWHCCYWWQAEPGSSSQEIAHGAARTEADGSFPIEFAAVPDPSVAEKDEPTFSYTVYADVTDTSGETRSGQRSVNVGFTALAASMTADDWLTEEKPVEIRVATTTLDGEGQKAGVKVKVYRLRQPEKVVRPRPQGDAYRPPLKRPGEDSDASPPEAKPDPSNPDSWELGEIVSDQGLTTDAAGKGALRLTLAAGPYRAMLQTQDRFGKKVTARLPLGVLKPDARKFPIKVADFVDAPKWSVEPGGEFIALWGTGYEKARALVEIEHRQKIIQSFWTEPGVTQQVVKQKVTEAMRGGFTLRVTMVRENRAYLASKRVDVPWTNKDLKISWEHFTSKLGPGQKETWTAVITGPDAKKAVAEMVAALYDQSLDAYQAHDWMRGFGVFRQDDSNLGSYFENTLHQLAPLRGGWPVESKDARYSYRSFPLDVSANLWGYEYLTREGQVDLDGEAVGYVQGGGLMFDLRTTPAKEPAPGALAGAGQMKPEKFGVGVPEVCSPAPSAPADPGQAPAPPPDLSKVAARKNLNETAFFFPHLISDKDGVVKLEFTMPEALTQWKFLGFAHDVQLRSGYLQDSVVTAKDLMVQPNPPRFLREGDVIEFTVKVSNQSAAAQKGLVRLTLSDARTGKPVDAELGNRSADQPFDIPSKESRSFSWRLSVPDCPGPISYKAVGQCIRQTPSAGAPDGTRSVPGTLSDGEEGLLPVLSRRILVTESLPLPIRGPAAKQFKFQRLVKSGESKTLQHQSLTVQMVSNPSWYAVMALPYLMEYPYECSEQTFNRYYANSLARHIAQKDPKVRRVFDQWKGTSALDSPLDKYQDLKSVLLEETPWVCQAQTEGQARKNLGILFDDNRLNDEAARTFRKLAEMQQNDGAWPWFPGGPASDYMTLYITTGFGRLRHLGVKFDTAPAVKSLGRLDGWIDGIYRDILKHGRPEDNHLTSTVALYLYGRSFFLQDTPIRPEHKEAVDYFLVQARKHWLKVDCPQSQAHLALALKRFGDKTTPQDILRSIKERSVTSEELGMFWRDTELSWWWHRAPIETQAVMIEAFDEVAGDRQAAEECKAWLLKQKQTQDWKTTKATADAVYGLLLRGDDLLASGELVQVTLGNTPIKPEKVDAGTGFYEQRFLRTEIKPEFGRVTAKKADKGVAWGSLHWQYLEDESKVTPYEGTPLKLQKTLYVKQNTKKGPVLNPVKGPVQVGDELVVRILLRTDRDMEYVHMKDHRGSGTEPVNVLSQYKFQDGLGYYESTRDTASHFFIDYLPKGTYVFEYSVRAEHRGKYQTGTASIQCMYAPEFNSHSQSLWLEVR